MEELTEKKSRWWIWLIVLLVLVLGGALVYFLLWGSGIPSPPKLPD